MARPSFQAQMSVNRDLDTMTMMVTIQRLPYMVSAASVASFLSPSVLDNSVLNPIPATVITVDGLQTITSSWLRNRIDEMRAADDVFNNEFTNNILFRYSAGLDREPLVEDDVSFCLGAEKWCSWQFWRTEAKLSAGPYFLLGSAIHQAFRLYDDSYGAFMYGVLRSEKHSTR
jgi:hypothetical protein